MLGRYLAFLFLSVTPTFVGAQDTLSDESLPLIEYYVQNQSIEGFLQTLEKDVELSIDATTEVSGRLRNLRLDGRLDAVMDKVAAQLALDWYLFNGIIHISSKSEAGTRVIRLGDLSAPQAISALEESGIPTSQFPVQVTGEGSAIAVSGPPTLLALSEAVIEAIPEAQQVAAAPPNQKTIVVRRGIEIQYVPVN